MTAREIEGSSMRRWYEVHVHQAMTTINIRELVKCGSGKKGLASAFIEAID
jgi:hypothetical protein